MASKKITKEQKKKLMAEVRKEFPGDEMMQEIHFIRLMHYLKTKDLSPSEQIAFYRGPDRRGKKGREKRIGR